MMPCKDISERADVMLDRGRSRCQALQIRLHLVMCTGCNRFMGQMRNTRLSIERTSQTNAGNSIHPADAARVVGVHSRR